MNFVISMESTDRLETHMTAVTFVISGCCDCLMFWRASHLTHWLKLWLKACFHEAEVHIAS